MSPRLRNSGRRFDIVNHALQGSLPLTLLLLICCTKLVATGINLGIGAMMGAVLQAPLAALTALMDLTRNSEIVLPAMLCIVIANIRAAHGFDSKSIFQTQALMMGIDLPVRTPAALHSVARPLKIKFLANLSLLAPFLFEHQRHKSFKTSLPGYWFNQGLFFHAYSRRPAFSEH